MRLRPVKRVGQQSGKDPVDSTIPDRDIVRRILWVTPDRFDVKPDKSSWLEMARCLATLGWDVVVVAGRSNRSPVRRDDYGGIVAYVDAFDLPLIFRISVLFSISRWIKQNARVDDVLIINQDSLWLVPFLKRLPVRLVHLDFRTLPVDVHGLKNRLDWLLFWRLPVAWFGRRLGGYSFITERLRHEVEQEFGLDVHDYIIWHSAVNIDRFQPAVLKSTAVRGDRFRLLYHGSISPMRRLDLVIEAIAKGGLPDDFQFVIVGDGPERPALERQALQLGVERLIRFRGFVAYEQVVEEIVDADVCICPLPDRVEWNVSSPLKIFEYMACAKPMILTPIAAHEDVLSQSEFVVWTRGFDSAAIHRAILEAIERRSEITAAAVLGPDIVKGRFEWRVQAGVLGQYLERRCAAIRSSDDPHCREIARL